MTGDSRNRVIDVSIAIIAILMAVYHLVMVQRILVGPIQHQTIHLAFAITLVFMSSLRTARRGFRFINLFLLAAGIFVAAYILVDYDRLELARGFPTTVDMVVSFILVIVVLEASRKAWGMVFLILAGLMIVYLFFGQLLPYPVGHMKMPFVLMVSYLGIGLEGIFGPILEISANYVFLFVLFGALMEVSNANEFFLELGKLVGRKLRGGPAHTAILGSSLVGMVTGNAMANVILTGSFTIPLMKKTGFKPEIAGAIEAAASSGGQIMPPVMGATVFLLAQLTGIPYVEVMVASFIPALFYYISLFVAAELIASKSAIPPSAEQVSGRKLTVYAPVFVVPLGVLVWLLLARFSAMYAGFWAILAIVGISLIRKETRPSLTKLVNGIVSGAIGGAKIGVACAAIGIVVTTLTVTGLGQKITALVDMVAQGNLMLGLLLTMVVSIFLGTGLPTLAAYLIVGIIVAPALVRMGLPLMGAHLFVFYFAVMACVTPPNAPAALPASQIAKSKYILTGLHASRISLAGFIVPFAFLFNPALLMQHEDLFTSALALVGTLLGLIFLQAANYGYLFTALGIVERICLFASSALFMISVITHGIPIFFLGIAILIPPFVSVWRKVRLQRIQAAVSNSRHRDA